MREDRKYLLNELRRLLKNVDICVKSNTDWDITLVCPKNGEVYSLPNMGDTEVIPFESLQSIVKSGRKKFEDFEVFIDDVYCDSDLDITVEDVEEVLGLSRIRKGLEEFPNAEYFEYLLLEESKDNFETIVESMRKEIVERLIEKAIDLYRNDEFADKFKMQYMESALNVEGVFDDVDNFEKLK